jgi:hypothetical protein
MPELQANHPAQAIAAARILPDALVPENSGTTVWLSNVVREGEWILPRTFRIFTFMGNVELDLTEVRIGAGESVIDIRCIMGNVEIRVPPGIRVLNDGEGFLGNFEITRIGEVPPLLPDAPTIRITGNAYVGSVAVEVKGIVGPGWKDKLKAWTQRNG